MMAKMFAIAMDIAIGIGVAAAVLIDATLVRMVLAPATMELLRDRTWWLPAWLDRILPRLRVEAADEPESCESLPAGERGTGHRTPTCVSQRPAQRERDLPHRGQWVRATYWRSCPHQQDGRV